MNSSWPDWPYLRQAIVDAINDDEDLSLKHEAMFQDVLKLVDHLTERLGMPNGASKLGNILPGTTDTTDGRSFTVPQDMSLTVPKRQIMVR